ncbi:MAG: sugar phosphate nucleotidyltransferase [Candidatus Pacearchaeota archaeon]|nr:sugar phosphate nucleotidyltransferase [Candidatus Pacearchaeota archaeon]
MEVALVYMVAGLSSRFKGKIKQFAQVGPNNETLIEYSLNQAIKAGFDKIIFIVGDKTEDKFMEMFGNEYKGIPIYYAFQDFDKSTRDKPWGTVDALCSAEEFLDCPFVLCNGDDIYGESAFKKIIEHLKQSRTCATIGYKVKNCLSDNGGVNRGVFQTDEKNKLIKIKEIFSITKENFFEKGLNENSLCAVNIFLFFPELLPHLKKRLLEFKEENKEDRKVECILSDELEKLIEKENLEIYVHPTEEEFIGITNPGDEEIVRQILLSKLL